MPACFHLLWDLANRYKQDNYHLSSLLNTCTADVNCFALHKFFVLVIFRAPFGRLENKYK
jgi:hypothetical protein